MVIYDDGNIQLFQGREKIMEWLQRAFSQMQGGEKTKEQDAPVLQTYDTDSEDSDEEYKKRKSKKKPKKKKKKSKPVRFDEDSDEDSEEESIVFIESEDEHISPKSSTMELQVKPQKKSKSQMLSIAEIASQMEKDRKSTLGYREEDLPLQT